MTDRRGRLSADARSIFSAGLAAADAGEAVRRAVSLTGGELSIGPWRRALPDRGRLFVVGAGKAAWPMAAALEDILGACITAGQVTTKDGHGGPLEIITIDEAGHPVPDGRGEGAARRIIHLLDKAGEDDLVICLLSGGGSALLPLPRSPLTLEDKRRLTERLLECGAAIHEINALRKHLSGIKGGRLARAARPAALVSLVLSDVVGDDLDVIASGPTVPDRSTFANCRAIIDRYGIAAGIPAPVLEFLERGVRGEEEETPKPGDPLFDAVHTTIIGSSALSLEAAARKARGLGYGTLVLSATIEGEARDVARMHAAIAREVRRSGNPLPAPACILSGGETTVTIRGRGRGGRNQEFALAAAVAIDGADGIVILSGGTDGTDGPTDAAGAVVDGETVRRGLDRGKRAGDYLTKNDSYHFFEGTEEHLITGPTLTNVMDLCVMLVSEGNGAGNRAGGVT